MKQFNRENHMGYSHHSECCCCHHGHHEGHREHHEHNHGTKRQLLLIVAAAILLVVAVLIEKNCHLSTWQLLLVYLVPYLLVGHETLKDAAVGVAHGEAFNEHLLMAIATIGALYIGFLPGVETQFPEAVFVMLFFQVGELFEGYAEGKSRESIAHLMDIRPEVVHVVVEPLEAANEHGHVETEDLSPEYVGVGTIIVIRPGEKVPLDGIVKEGSTALNTVALTGESMPRELTIGDEVISGCVNLSGVIKVVTTKSYGESTASKIINLVEHASEHKSQSETFIRRFARVYTPMVVIAALLLAVLPPVVLSLCGQLTFSECFGGL